MAKKRSNPFSADGSMSKAAWKANTTNEAVKVTAHERKRPIRQARGPANVAQTLRDGGEHVGYGRIGEPVSDNAFHSEAIEEPQGQQRFTAGLVGEKSINHLKAAIGLIRKGRA